MEIKTSMKSKSTHSAPTEHPQSTRRAPTEHPQNTHTAHRSHKSTQRQSNQNTECPQSTHSAPTEHPYFAFSLLAQATRSFTNKGLSKRTFKKVTKRRNC